MDRHARQARLVGVGRDGQARVRRAQVDLALDGLAADVAARYLAGAGVARVRVRSEAAAEAARAIDRAVVVLVDPSLGVDEPGETAAWGIRDPAAQQLARGAIAALRSLRHALRDVS